jgi:hypothetical protein
MHEVWRRIMPTLPLKRGERIKIYEKNRMNVCNLEIETKKKRFLFQFLISERRNPTIKAYRQPTRHSVSNPPLH